MFRITVVESPSEEKWILQGQLTEEFAPELSASWRLSLERCADRIRIVDLSDVTWIDKTGEEVLISLMNQGAKFIATGIYTRYLLGELQARSRKHEHKKAE